MLILSRRTNETIAFPSLGVSVTVCSVQGSRVRIGVTAPPEISVLRGELNAEQVGPSNPSHSPPSDPRCRELDHQVKNQLNVASLGLQLAQRQWDHGQFEGAQESLHKALRLLAELEQLFSSQASQQVLAPAISLNTSQSTGPVCEVELKPWTENDHQIDVLLVEDDANERALLQGLLEHEGYTVQTAVDGQHALECLTTAQPRVVLMDINMPRSSGKQAIDRIRDHQHLRDLPICVVSGSSPDAAGLSESSRITEWFPKPLNTRRLIDRLREKVLPC